MRLFSFFYKPKSIASGNAMMHCCRTLEFMAVSALLGT